MNKLRINAPVDQVTALLARFAHLNTELALADTARNDAIAAANVVADQVTVPIVTEMDEIRAQLQPWWERNRASLLTGRRWPGEWHGSCSSLLGSIGAAQPSRTYCRALAVGWVRASPSVLRVNVRPVRDRNASPSF